MHDLIWHLLMLAFWGSGFMAGVFWKRNRGKRILDRIIKDINSEKVAPSYSKEQREASILMLVGFRHFFYEKYDKIDEFIEKIP